MPDPKPILSIIVAIARNRVIGRGNRLPWHLPADLRHFKQTTMGHPIIMGRKTYESIGRPLPGRQNIVITRNRDYYAEGCLVVHSLQEALAAVPDAEEVFIIGGASLYREALPLADRIYLTLVDAEVEGDTVFPELDASEWREVQRETFAPDEKNPYGYAFVELVRKRD
ncbi:MAG: type 3 dihydrofolate reductase [candidate division KSB1 bacterium]|nr:type 3 dihydrofolate reductase [candidate division KSB1 bacterium]MDQ7063664.1 type 3 dihydrofolate reductase [candidate division KSB1 bacterium]